MRVASRLLSTAAVAAAMTVGLVGTSLAQDATPTAMEGEEELTLLSHLHQGSCAEHGDEPVQSLADLQFPGWVAAMAGGDEDDVADAAIVAEDFGNVAVPAAAATTEVSIPLADIIAGQHAIEIESADPADPEDAVACGDIGGTPDENGDLFVGIGPLNDSGHFGVAWLHDNGANTTVVVFLAHPEVQERIGATLATLIAAAAEEGEEAVAEEAAAEATPEEMTPEADAAATPIA